MLLKKRIENVRNKDHLPIEDVSLGERESEGVRVNLSPAKHNCIRI